MLQQKPATEDDGSLSRLAAARGVRYVNLETQMGQAERQKEMLEWLEWVLPDGETRSRDRQGAVVRYTAQYFTARR